MLKLLTQLAPVLVVLFPAIQCWTYSRGIDAANAKISALEQDKADLEQQINVLLGIKATEDKRSAAVYATLEVRLKANEKLLKETRKANEKLALVKSLMRKYASISAQLESFKAQYPTLGARKP